MATNQKFKTLYPNHSKDPDYVNYLAQYVTNDDTHFIQRYEQCKEFFQKDRQPLPIFWREYILESILKCYQ